MAKTFLTDIDLNKNELQNSVIQNLAAAPSNPVAGQIYFNTTQKAFYIYDGTKWVKMNDQEGSVTSVDLSSSDSTLAITGGPITSSGTIDVKHANSVTAKTTQGLYPIAFDAHGHITGAGAAQTIPTKVSELNNDEGYITGIDSSDITTALGYTPYNSSNPDGFISGITGSDVTTALGYTPYNATNPNGYITSSALPKKLTDLTNDLSYMTAYNATSNKIATAADLAGIAGGMYFKGTIGTGGTAGTNLPTSGVSVGDTYRISSKGTYNGESCEVGDLFIATATTPTWAYIPSGNDAAVTSITAGTGLTGGTITSTGTIGLATSGVTAGTYNGITVDQYGRVTGAVDEGYTDNEGTVTSVGLTNATNGGLTVSGSPITTNGTITVGHTNVLANAQTTSAVYPIKIDKNGHISEYGTAVTILKKYATTLTGDNSKTSFTVTHNLGSRDVTVQVYDGTSYEEVMVDITRNTTNQVTIGFAQAVATGKTYRVVVIG
jgi:hypothetical protein